MLLVFYFSLWLQIIHISSAGNFLSKLKLNGTPVNFPPNIAIQRGSFINWANDLVVTNLWIATPENENEIVQLANWAQQNGYNLRASGYMHNWSILTVTGEGNESKNTVLVNLKECLDNIETPTPFGDSGAYQVTAQTGVSMLQLLTFLEDNGLGLYGVPAPGDLTLGGVLAIGGHGTGVPFEGETIPPGMGMGTISNLVISFEAVVWNETSNAYVLQKFQRSDVKAAAFLVSLGRTIITEVTLLVGQNYNLRCVSSTSITKSELFSPVPGPNSFSSFLNQTGRVETISFAFTSTPWLKVWSIEDTKPPTSVKVSQPFNYIFSDNIPQPVAALLGLITAGAWHLTPSLGQAQLTAVTAGLVTTLTSDIWGPSKNLLLYIKPTTLRLTANGYAVMTQRANVQQVIYTFNTFFDNLVASYQRKGKFPFNGQMEIRATYLDEPNVVTNGQPPAFSPILPLDDHPEYDIVIWINILSIPYSPYLDEAMKTLENFMLTTFNGTYASIRPEWSKGWAYTNEKAWSSQNFIRNFIPSTFPGTAASGWNWAVETLQKYDPHGVFTNSFIDDLLQTV